MTGQFHVVQLDEYAGMPVLILFLLLSWPRFAADFHVLHESLVKLTGADLFPYVFVKGDYVAGGMEKLTELSKSGVLEEWLKDHQYDLVVIGGGSGGLAAAKVSANFAWWNSVYKIFHNVSGSCRSWKKSSRFRLCRSDSKRNNLG